MSKGLIVVVYGLDKTITEIYVPPDALLSIKKVINGEEQVLPVASIIQQASGVYAYALFEEAK
jgi:hypothetical protein